MPDQRPRIDELPEVVITRRRRTADSQQVYIIRDGEYAKVGIARDTLERVAQLQTGNPRDLEVAYTINVDTEYAGWIEREAHARLRRKHEHVRGEWFLATDLQAKKAIKRAIDIITEMENDNTPTPEMDAAVAAMRELRNVRTYDERLKISDPDRYALIQKRRKERAHLRRPQRA